ncbi:eukaryotic translation initiation factor eIF2A-domain-containing protein [Suillus ampliporus]|nr:eukaryotic translation initiation factor eIF2A-domain-containing protein [Suillus ampliporus]
MRQMSRSCADEALKLRWEAGDTSTTYCDYKARRKCLFVAEKKRAPAIVEIYGLSTLSGAPTCSKTFYKADRAQIKWNDIDTKALILTQTEVDNSNKSYVPPQCSSWLLFLVMPAKTTLFDQRVRTLHDFRSSPLNFISFNPQDRLVALVGFGNLAGKIDIFDRRTLSKICIIDAPNTSFCEWSPCGRFLLTGTLSPHLRVDNVMKVWHYTSGLVHMHPVEELYQAWWRLTPLDQAPQFGQAIPATSQPSFIVLSLFTKKFTRRGVEAPQVTWERKYHDRTPAVWQLNATPYVPNSTIMIRCEQRIFAPDGASGFDLMSEIPNLAFSALQEVQEHLIATVLGNLRHVSREGRLLETPFFALTNGTSSLALAAVLTDTTPQVDAVQPPLAFHVQWMTQLPSKYIITNEVKAKLATTVTELSAVPDRSHTKRMSASQNALLFLKEWLRKDLKRWDWRIWFFIIYGRANPFPQPAQTALTLRRCISFTCRVRLSLLTGLEHPGQGEAVVRRVWLKSRIGSAPQSTSHDELTDRRIYTCPCALITHGDFWLAAGKKLCTRGMIAGLISSNLDQEPALAVKTMPTGDLLASILVNLVNVTLDGTSHISYSLNEGRQVRHAGNNNYLPFRQGSNRHFKSMGIGLLESIGRLEASEAGVPVTLRPKRQHLVPCAMRLTRNNLCAAHPDDYTGSMIYQTYISSNTQASFGSRRHTLRTVTTKPVEIAFEIQRLSESQ